MSTVDLKEFNVPGRGRGLIDVFRRRYLLKLLVRKTTSTRYRNSVLGWTWSYVRPLIRFMVYWLILGVVLGVNRGVDNFPLYMFAGFSAITFFNDAFSKATGSVVANKSLVKKIYLPRELFPVAAVIDAFVHFLPQVAILVIVAIFYGWAPGAWHIGAALLGLLLIALVALGMGILFAGINVRYRDAGNFADVIQQVSLWLSPVLYPWQMIQDTLGDTLLYIYLCNPLTVAVELLHYGFWAPTVSPEDAAHPGGWTGFPPHFGIYIGVALAIGVALIFLGQLTFRRFERTFAQDV
ncbi:ABC transporter permease [Microbacterium halophytorum]|uniref:ABC transporter permease n=1 Tax=Microbacterium halophytorum TaxID=2067568 RepID=UPI000CFE0D9E|nr:ABC transporter permease [Microbacterium halophytorum]